MFKVATLAKRALNYGADKSQQIVATDPNEIMHNELTSSLVRTQLTMKALGVTLEGLHEAQENYNKSLQYGTQEERKANLEIVQSLQKLIDIEEKSDKSKLFDKVFNRKITTKQEAEQIIAYTEEISKQLSILNQNNKAIDVYGLFDTLFDAVSDKRLDSSFRHTMVKEFTDFIKTTPLMEHSTHLQSIENILRQGSNLESYNIEPLLDHLADLLVEFKSAQTAHDLTVSLEDADLSDTGTHDRLEVLSKLLQGITGLQQESNELTGVLTGELKDNERELEQTRAILRRVADQTVATKTLHSLNNIENKFDTSLLNDEKMQKSLSERLKDNFRSASDKISKGSGLFGTLAQVVLGALGLAGLIPLMKSVFGGLSAGFNLVSGALSTGLSIIKTVGAGFLATYKIIKWVGSKLTGLIGGIWDFFTKKLPGFGGKVFGRSTVAKPPVAIDKPNKTTAPATTTKTKPTAPATTKPLPATGAATTTAPPVLADADFDNTKTKTTPTTAPDKKPSLLEKTKTRLANTRAKVKSSFSSGMRMGGGGSWKTKLAGTVLTIGGSMFAMNALANSGDNTSTHLDTLSKARTERLESLEGQSLTAENLAMVDLTNSIDMLNESILSNTLTIGQNTNATADQTSNLTTAVATTGAVVGAGALATMALKPEGLLGGTDIKPTFKEPSGVANSTADLAKKTATSGLPHFAKDAKQMETVNKSLEAVKKVDMVPKSTPKVKVPKVSAGGLLGAGINTAMAGYAYYNAQSNAERNAIIASTAIEGAGALAGAQAGGALGASIGATVGSIVPGAGTAVGGAVGAGIGGIVGGIAGWWGSSKIGDKFNEWFNDPIDHIPDEAKEAGPLAELAVVEDMLNQADAVNMDEDDRKELIDYRNKLISKGHIGAWLARAFKANGVDISSLTKEQVQSEVTGLLQAGQINLPTATMETLMSNVGSAFDNKAGTRIVSSEEQSVRNKIGDNAKEGSYNAKRAMYGAYNRANNTIYYNNAIAEEGQVALERMKQKGVSQEYIDLAQQQLDNQQGMSLSELKEIHGDKSVLNYTTDTGSSINNADQKPIIEAADATMKIVETPETQKDLTKSDLDELQKRAEIANKKNDVTQDKALASKVTDWLAGSLPQTILPLVGLSPELNLQVMDANVGASGIANDTGIDNKQTIQNIAPMQMQTGSIGTAYTGATSTNLNPKLAKNIRTGGSFAGQIDGLSKEQASALAGTLAQRESGGNQTVENKWGYMGLYQFGAAALAETGLINMAKYQSAIKQNPGIANGSDAQAHKAFLNDPSNWNLQGGKQAFLASKDQQDIALGKLMNKNKRYMESKGYQFKDATDLGGGLLAAHLKGAGSAVKWKTKGIASHDANGTGTDSYDALGAAAINASGSTNMSMTNSIPNKVQGAPMLNNVVNTANAVSTAVTASNIAQDMAQVSIKGTKSSVNTFDPVGTGVITSLFGPRNVDGGSKNHKGVDFRAPVGTPVRVPMGGVIEAIGNQPGSADRHGGGKWITVNHGNGFKTRYMHLDAINVKEGQNVAIGQVIATSGNSGSKTTGTPMSPHLHYETWLNGKPVDPTTVDYRTLTAKTPSPTDIASVEATTMGGSISGADTMPTTTTEDGSSSESSSVGGGMFGSMLGGITNAISSNPLAKAVLGDKASAIGTWVNDIATKLDSGEMLQPKVASVSSLVPVQGLPNPTNALTTQSTLKGQAQGATVATAESSNQSVIIQGQTAKSKEVGQGRPKQQVDDPLLLIAQTQAFNS